MGVVAVRRICVLGIALVALAGCGSSNKAPSTSTAGTTTTAKIPPVSEDATLAAEVPPAIRSAGTLTVGTDASYPPNEFLGSRGKGVTGVDPDLINAVAEVLGLKAKFVNEPFVQIIPAVAGGTFTVGASSITDTKEREQEVDFVTYLSAGQALLSRASGPHVTSLAEVCGRRVAVERGTLEQSRILEQAGKCHTSIGLSIFSSQDEANAAFLAGHVEVDYADAPVINYLKQQLGGSVYASPSFSEEPYGFAIAKDNGLAQPMLAALKVLMKDGTYAAILKRWKLQGNAISNPVINGAKS